MFGYSGIMEKYMETTKGLGFMITMGCRLWGLGLGGHNGESNKLENKIGKLLT